MQAIVYHVNTFITFPSLYINVKHYLNTCTHLIAATYAYLKLHTWLQLIKWFCLTNIRDIYIYIYINKSLTINCHPVPLTTHSGGGLFDRPRLLIHCRTKFLSSYSKPTFKNLLLYFTMNYIHRLLTYLVFHLNKTQLYRKYCRE